METKEYKLPLLFYVLIITVESNRQAVVWAGNGLWYCEGGDGRSPCSVVNYPDLAHLNRDFGGCHTCCCHKSSPQEFCDFLTKDDDTSWLKPFRGLNEKGEEDASIRCSSWNYCGGVGGYRMGTVHNRVLVKNLGEDDPSRRKILQEFSNKLRFRKEVIAQEGISFCIVGRHFRQTQLSLWEPLRGFQALAEKSFDIGNHIHPHDSTKMKVYFKKPDPRTLFGRSDAANNNPWSEIKDMPYEFEHVWKGTRNQNRVNCGGTQYVEMEQGFENRPAHPEWQPYEGCVNPYVVIPSLINVDGDTLHNYLHIRVIAEPVTQPSGKNCPSGRMKLLMLEVRDQDGYAVGQFTDDIPCDRDERTENARITCPSGVECRRYTGTKKNHIPCMFSPPKATVVRVTVPFTISFHSRLKF